jgi:hypothetical protein
VCVRDAKPEEAECEKGDDTHGVGVRMKTVERGAARLDGRTAKAVWRKSADRGAARFVRLMSGLCRVEIRLQREPMLLPDKQCRKELRAYRDHARR